MIKKIVLHFWSLRIEFAKYFIIGISAYLLDVFSLYFLKQRLGLNATLAVVVNQPPIILFVFLLNKHWSFGAKGMATRQMVKFGCVVAMNYFISVIWMASFNHYFGFNYLVVRTANVAVAVGWNFLLYKHWVYAVKTADVSQ